MNTIKILGLTVRNRVVGLAIRNIDTTKYEPLKELIWQYLVNLESNSLSSQDNEDFYYKLAFWRNEIVCDKNTLSSSINSDGYASFNKLESSITSLMEEIPCSANYKIKRAIS